MIKQCNMFQQQIDELTPMERAELQVKRQNEILRALGIETKGRKHKKLKPIPIEINKYLRCSLGIYRIVYITNKYVGVQDLNTKRNEMILLNDVYSIANDPYELLDKGDKINVKLDNGIIRLNEIYDTFRMKNNELRFMVMDCEDGEVIDITKNQIFSIKEIMIRKGNKNEKEIRANDI